LPSPDARPYGRSSEVRRAVASTAMFMEMVCERSRGVSGIDCQVFW
jgi:hypothetical protein